MVVWGMHVDLYQNVLRMIIKEQGRGGILSPNVTSQILCHVHKVNKSVISMY